MNNYDYFSVLVIGENPDDQMLRFDLMADTDKPYIVYKHSDKSKIRKNKIKIYEELLKTHLSKKDTDSIRRKISELKIMTDDEYYNELSEMHFLDEKTGNIIDTENPDGKWITCDKGGKIYSSYLKDFNGNGVVSSTVGSVDWDLIHLNQNKVGIYERTWDLCVNNSKPETDQDHIIIKNMSRFVNYFDRFKDKEEYVKFSCSFFTNAVVIHGQWYDMDKFNDSTWIINYFDNFIKKLDKNEKVTIYECTK